MLLHKVILFWTMILCFFVGYDLAADKPVGWIVFDIIFATLGACIVFSGLNKKP